MSSSAGSKSADARRTERVESANRLLQAVWEAARRADAGKWDDLDTAQVEIEARSKQLVEAFRREAAAAREGERSGKAVHGQNQKNAQVERDD